MFLFIVKNAKMYQHSAILRMFSDSLDYLLILPLHAFDLFGIFHELLPILINRDIFLVNSGNFLPPVFRVYLCMDSRRGLCQMSICTVY